MKIVFKEEVLEKKEFFVNEILEGKIFVFPTDTIYGIGCDAYNFNSVKKIRDAKKRENKPFSVVSPSKKWVLKNCVVRNNEIFEKYNEKVTLIFDLKCPIFLAKNIFLDKTSLGVRVSNNWFSDLIAYANVPFVATSVNISGEKHIERIEELEDELIRYIDYYIDEGKLESKASKIIDVREKEERVLRD